MLRRDGDWDVHFVFERSVAVADESADLAIGVSARWVATCTFPSDRNTTFCGEKVRRIREHYKRLQSAIGKAKP